MKKKVLLVISLIMTLSVLGVSCGPRVEPTPTIDPQAVMTEVAQTISAELTQVALLTPSPTATVPPTATPQPLPTQALPPAPTSPAGTGLLPTLPAASPDNATWIADVTVPDNTLLAKNSKFTKTWKVENSGTTTWNSNYALIYLDGSPIPGTTVISIVNEVKPKVQVELSVVMQAPATDGTYTVWFRMMNDKGQLFGDWLYVKFIVGAVTPTPAG
ncbi:MAG: hypothetical protein FJZ98_05255 [Chloroflexi bacterium]|nr:hypothetical protein [Chloroflexota bacterium]